MDIGRRPYKTACRFLRDDDTVSEVSWIEARPDAPTLPFPSIILSRDMQQDAWEEYEVGEVLGAPRPFTGKRAPLGLDGDHHCGTEEEFGEGGLFDDVTPLAEYDADGFLKCCVAPKRLAGGGGGGGKAVVVHGTLTLVGGGGQFTASARTHVDLLPGVQTGDLRLVHLCYVLGGLAPAVPTGWVLVDKTEDVGAGMGIICWSRVAVLGDPNSVTYPDIFRAAVGWSETFRSWTAVSQYGTHATAVGDATLPFAPSITPPSGRSYVLMSAVSQQGGIGSPSLCNPPPGMTGETSASDPFLGGIVGNSAFLLESVGGSPTGTLVPGFFPVHVFGELCSSMLVV